MNYEQKKENLKIKHSIPIGSLVEIVAQDENDDFNMIGVRMFVVMHTRDCDKTPLYVLCSDPDDEDFEFHGLKFNKRHGGFSEYDLRLIR